MIRLGKDKTLDNYFIDENGVITDENGTVQEVKLYKGLSLNQDRPGFKGQYIHKIMMYTFYGWRDGKIWAIHHKDENKLNNSLENLVYITRSEHTSIHSKGNNFWGGKHHSEKTKAKMSEAKKGKKLSLETKKKMSEAKRNMSEETKKKMSLAKKGHIPWNKGLKIKK